MTYKGVEVEKPTLTMIEEYCKRNQLDIFPGEVYKHYFDKKWLDKDKVPITSVESMCNTWNNTHKKPKKKSKDKKDKKAKVNKRKPSPAKKNPKSKLVSITTIKPTKDSWIPYDEQLQDRRWKAFREFIFSIRGRWCEHCGSPLNLQIHHPKYITGRMAWEYTCNEVRVLCRKCHAEAHGKPIN